MPKAQKLAGAKDSTPLTVPKERSVQLALERLQGIYDRALAATSRKNFFLVLYEYVEMTDSDAVLEPVMVGIRNTEKDDTGHMEELGQKIIEETQKVEPKIREYVKAKKVTNEQALTELKDYGLYQAGKLHRHGSTEPETHYGFIVNTLRYLVEDKSANHVSFARQFGRITDEGKIEDWEFAPSYEQWEQERRYWNRLQITRVWYSLKQIVTFYLVYRDAEKMHKASVEKGEDLNALGISLYFGDIQALIEEKNGPDQYRGEFQQEEYRAYLQRVHGVVRNELLKISHSILKNDWSFDPSSGVLLIIGKTIKFKPSSFRAQVLAMLCRDEATKRKNWQWDEIYEEVEGVSEAPGGAKEKVYEAIKGIAEQITKQSGGAIMDFLTFDTRTVHINPSYL